jgi:hypothetical protein
MRFLLRALALLFIALPIAAVLLLATSLQNRPLVSGVAQLTPDDIERAKQVVRTQDPRTTGGAGPRTMSIEEEDLALAVNYLASQAGRGAARVALRPGVARFQVTLEVPPNPLGRYVNIDASLRETGTVPKLDQLKIGNLPVAGFVADYILTEAVRRLTATDPEFLATRIIQAARFGDGRLTVTYRWSDETAALARSVLIAPQDQERLRAYQERLADAVSGAPRSLSLAALMSPLFRLALERGADGSQVRENRAVIVVLALYATGTPLDRVVTAAAGWRKPARRIVTLAGRDDFPKHFLVSAAIAAEAGSPLADAIGVHKEIEDSRGGSGFSFNDIGANRAGTRFGEVASQSPQRARELARALASGVAESDFMPDVSDLPEFLAEAEFKRRFGSLGSPAYETMIASIEQRIDALPLLRR